jgi:TRAP-type C4-dicarboxylate transport system permease small subunit
MSAWVAAENLVLAAALAMMALLPLGEIVLRSLFHTGISGAATLGQHCGLLAGMLGAAVAAREGRLLSLSTLPAFLPKAAARLCRWFGATVAATVAALLVLAGAQLVLAEHDGGTLLVEGIPAWVGQMALPLGFAIIAVRLALAAGTAWPARVVTIALALAVPLLALAGTAMQGTAAAIALAVLVTAALGAPLFCVLGGIALVLFWGEGLPLASVALDHCRCRRWRWPPCPPQAFWPPACCSSPSSRRCPLPCRGSCNEHRCFERI